MRRNNRHTKKGIRIGILSLGLVFILTGCLNERDKKMARINAKLDTIQGYIDENYLDEVDEERMEDFIYKGYMAGLNDPYADYYTKEEYKALMEQTTGVYHGIGVTVSQNIQTKVVGFVKVFENGPGYEAGLLPGDQLVKIDGEPYSSDDSLDEIVSRVKGEEGTSVKLTIQREGEPDYLDFTVERRSVEIPTISYQMLDNQIGYILVSEFDKITSKQFAAAIDDLDQKGQKGMIVDLRNNLGGNLQPTIEMLDRMLPKGLLVYTETKDKTRVDYNAEDDIKFDKPLVVLVNGASASASEVFAGAIKDYGTGTLIGTTTFGKGIVQHVIPIEEDGSAIKMTVAKYYTPKGKYIHEIGIEPDITIDLEEKLKSKLVVSVDEDNQIQKAVEVLQQKISSK